MVSRGRYRKFLDHRGGELLALTARASNGRYRPRGKTAQADCVVGYSFGFQKGPGDTRLPGPANQALADFAAGFKLPKFLQSEIDEACKPHLTTTDVRLGLAGAKYVDSYAVFLESQRFLKLHGYSRPLLIAHPYHVPRLDAMYRRAGLKAVIPKKLPAVWDKQSVQYWTRSPGQWRAREIGALTYYLLRGWI